MLLSLLINLLLLPFLPWRWWRRRTASQKGGIVSVTIAGHVEEITRRQRTWLPLQQPRRTFSLYRFTRLCEVLLIDPRVRGLRLCLEPFEGGWAVAEGLREAIAKVAEKKPVWCELSKGGGLKEYFVASAASTLAMAPPTSLRLVGMGARSLYFGGVVERLGLEIEVEQRHEWKSAGETFSGHGMSSPARAQTEMIIEALKSRIFGAIGKRGALLGCDLDTLLTSGPYRAAKAKEEGLVDVVCFADALDDTIAPEEKRHVVEGGAYLKRRLRRLFRPLRQRVIAVARLSGTIVDAGGAMPNATEHLVDLLEAAGKSRRVAAVVLLVNSRGGGALGSALIHHAACKLRQKKPVIAYFSDYAASGGYYAGVAASRIVCRPMAVTGSIGVVALRPVIDTVLARLGINRDGVVCGAHAGLLDATQRWNSAEHAAVKKEIDGVYAEFTSVVALARKLDEPAIDAVARGRVWLGEQAVERGLVDTLGGLAQALKEAADAAGLAAPGEPVLLLPPRRFRLPLAALAQGGILCFESLQVTT